MKSEKVAKEVAEVEFARMCQLARVDTDDSEWSEDDKVEWSEQKAALMKLIQNGTLLVADDGRPTLCGLTFNGPTGADVMVVGSGKTPTDGMIAAMAQMCGVDRGAFAKLHAKDYYSCLRIGQLFLAQG